MSITVEAAISRMTQARRNAVQLEPLSLEGEFSIERAYEIQEEFRQELVRTGVQPIGWKLAATGPTGQSLFGVNEPIYGFLPPEVYPSGDEVSAREFARLHVEAEFAFKLGRDLSGPGVTAQSALDAVECVMPALELPDASFSGSPNVSDAIANSALGKAIMVGNEYAPIAPSDLAQEEVTFVKNGDVVSTNSGSELMGDPLNALAWLANQLAQRHLTLRQGDLVMSGAVSALLPAQAGDTFIASYRLLGSVELKVVA